MDKPLKVGLIGYGTAGSVFHAPLISAVPDLQLAAIVTRQVDAARAKYPGVTTHASLAELLAERSDIDVVVIATPNESHVALALEAIEAGVAVVVDKPLAVSVQEADRLLQRAAECGMPITVFQNRRLDGDFQTVRRVIESGVLGEVLLYEAHFHRFRPEIKPGWRETRGVGGGILFDLGAHLIDHALQLFGMPDSVLADIGAQRAAAMADDYFHLTLLQGRRRIILKASTLVADPGPRFAVHGTGGSLLTYGIDPQEAALRLGVSAISAQGASHPGFVARLTDIEGQQEEFDLQPGRYTSFYEGVSEWLRGRASAPVDARDARSVLQVIEAAARSARERRRIELGPFPDR